MEKAPDAFRTISEVADEIDVPQHVLRFWESRFAQIRPMKRGGGRRYYRPDDVDLLRGVRHLLYGEGYTIRGVQRILRDMGAGFVQNVWRAGATPPPLPPPQAEEDSEEFAEQTSGAKPSLSGYGAQREPKIMPAAAVEPSAQPGRGGRAGGAGDARRKLQSALDDLIECRHLLDAARRQN